MTGVSPEPRVTAEQLAEWQALADKVCECDRLHDKLYNECAPGVETRAAQKSRDEARASLADALDEAAIDGSLSTFFVAVRSQAEQIERLTAEIELGKLNWFGPPLGDNHHNAEMCPYCSPKRLELEAALAAEREKVARVETWLRRVVGNGKDWFEAWAWETLPELGAALSTQEDSNG